jgi:hypothetical protein
MDLGANIIGNLAYTVLGIIILGALNQAKSLAPVIKYLFTASPSFIANLISISLILFVIIKISFNEVEPKIIFAEKIIFRKVQYGQRSKNLISGFALSPKIGIKNKVKIYDTKLTLCYMRCRQAERDNMKHVERRGVEEFSTTANYVETVHRYSFFSEDLSYGLLKPISEAQGAPNLDRIILILTGFYGRKPKPFMRKHEYNFSDIKFADQTPKVVEYHYQNNQIIEKVKWENFHLVDYSEETSLQRIHELKELLREKYVKPAEHKVSKDDKSFIDGIDGTNI